MSPAAPRFGTPHEHHESIGSTNVRMRELAESGAPSGAIVTAGVQVTGRGRGGRAWTTPPNTALLSSTLYRPEGKLPELLSLAVAVATCEACESLAPVDCRIKWPNDIWLGERKLAGILIEARPPEWAIIGVGINLSIPDDAFPADLPRPATSLGHGVGADAMREALTDALGRWAEADPTTVRDEFNRRDALAGREISWEGGPEGTARTGTAAGIDEHGNLLVRAADGTETALGSGEVHLQLGAT